MQNQTLANPFKIPTGAVAVYFAQSLLACSHTRPAPPSQTQTQSQSQSLLHARFLDKVSQVTHGGSNTHAHWSFDGSELTYQFTPSSGSNEDPGCQQVYKIKKTGAELLKLSDDLGQAVNPSFFPNGKRILFTAGQTLVENPKDPTCRKHPESRPWDPFTLWLDPTSQIYGVKPDSTDPIPLEPGAPRGYHAEATVCRNGNVLFTSNRNGSLELYSATLDSLGLLTHVHAITQDGGYAGGATFSPDCKKIAWHAFHPRPGSELDTYRHFLKRQVIRPPQLEIWMADPDGKNAVQVTQFKALSFSPAFTPNQKQILFTSNVDLGELSHPNTQEVPRSPSFHLYLINLDGSDLTPVTSGEGFEKLAAFSPDGRKVVFSAGQPNPNPALPTDLNLYVADWISKPN